MNLDQAIHTFQQFSRPGIRNQRLFEAFEQALLRRSYMTGGFPKSFANTYLALSAAIDLLNGFRELGDVVVYDRNRRKQVCWFENQADHLRYAFALGHPHACGQDGRVNVVVTAGRGPEFDDLIGIGRVGQPRFEIFSEKCLPYLPMLLLDPESRPDQPSIWMAAAIRVDQDNRKLIEVKWCHKIEKGGTEPQFEPLLSPVTY